MKGFLVQTAKLSPIILLCTLVMTGTDTLIAAPLALIYAAILCVIFEKCSFTDVFDSAVENAKGGMIVFFVMMLAYGVATFFMTTGVGACIIQAALLLGITGRSVAAIAFIVTCILSISTGTSWGSFAAVIPIFMWLSHIVGGDPALTLCACAGGAAFGDNVALISDTTIFSSGIQGVNIVDRFNKQILWSLSCVAVSSVLFYVSGLALHLSTSSADAAQAISSIPEEAWEALEKERPAAVELLNQVLEGSTPYYMIIPVVIVIALAVKKVPTMVCLFSGIFSAALLGILVGTITSFSQFAGLLYDSFADAGSWVIIMMMWVVAFGGVMGKMNAFRPIANFFIRISRKVRHLMTCNAILCIIGNMLLSDEVAQMATIGPVIKEIVEENVEASEEDMYELKCRNAVFSDALGVLGSELIPWHVCSIYYVGLAVAVYPLAHLTAVDLIQFNFFAWISIISLLILTFTGLDRFIPKFGIPREPQIKLKKENLKQIKQ